MAIGRSLRFVLAMTLGVTATAAWAQHSAVLLTSGPAQQKSAAPPQTAAPEDDTPFYRSVTRAVVLDVVVIGPDGNPVAGLKQSDFHLTEDSSIQNIQYFRAPAAETSATAKPAGRTVLLVDELNSKFSDLGYAEYSVRKLLSRSGQLAEPTALMVLTGKGLKVIQDYTRDGPTLLNALHTHRNDMTMSLYDQSLSNQTETNDVENIEHIQHIESLTLGALSELSEANLASDMRQTVVWITPGLQPRNTMPIFGASDLGNLGPALKRISDVMLRSRTVLYAIDPQGVGMGQTLPYVPVNGLNGAAITQFMEAIGDNGQTGLTDVALQSLTRNTGGKYFYGRNDVDIQIAKSMAMGNSAYMISYTPTNHTFDGQYRKIKITVDNPAYVVLTRPGYYALPTPTPDSEKVTKYQIDHAVVSRLDYSSLTVKVVPGQVVDQKQQITLSVDSRGLRWERQADGRYETQISIMAVAFDSKGKALYSVKRNMHGDLAADAFEANRGKPWTIAMDVPMDPKQNRIRVVVRDQRSGEIGSAETTDIASAAGMKRPTAH